MPHTVSTAIRLVIAASLGACTGVIDDPTIESRSGGPPASGMPGATSSVAGPAATGGGGTSGGSVTTGIGMPGAPSVDFDLPAGAGARPRLWRLTDGQYKNAIKDLLNITVTTPLPADDGGGFGNRSSLLDVSQALLEAYSQAAETAANQMIPARLGELLTCQPVNAASATCV